MEKIVYDLVETAEMLGMSYRTVYNLIKDGNIKAVKIGGNWRVSAEELQRIVKHGTDSPKPSTPASPPESPERASKSDVVAPSLSNNR